MSSFTSSSSSGLSAQLAAADPAPRGPYVKALLAVVLGLAAAQVVLLIMIALFDASAETIISRVTEARSYLPQIVEQDEDLVMSFGSSLTAAAFSARQFDRQMAERGIQIKSYNFGFGGLNPFFQDYLSRRIRDEFQSNDKRLKLVLIEFTPLQNTRARWNGALPSVDSYVAMLADGGDIWDIVKRDPTRGIRVAEIKYLRNEISAEMTTHYFGREIFGGPSRPGAGIPEDEAKDATLSEIGDKLSDKFSEEYPDYDGCSWCWNWQGAGTIPEERGADTLEMFVPYFDALRSEQRLADDRLRRVTCCDIEELRFEETLVAGFIRTVKNFQEFSDTVEVIMLPRNHDWIQRPPEAWERLNAVLERIERETGVTIRSFEDFTKDRPDMFSDTTHLARYQGDVPYTSLLVETYAPILAR